MFAANGVNHEILAWLLVGRVQGYQLAFFSVQGAAVVLTWKWRPRGWMRWAAWLGTIAFMVVSSVLFFATLQQVTGWYTDGGLLP